MVVASPNPIIIGAEKAVQSENIEVPVIDLSGERREEVSRLIVKASEEYGFFKVINHGVPDHIIARMEQQALDFFSKPVPDKQRAGPPTPLGYGCNNIGFNGDIGQVEYLLFDTNPLSISHLSYSISADPYTFSGAVSGYIEAVRGLACEILDLMAQGLWVQDSSVFSRMIRDVDSDSLFRLNYYPPILSTNTNTNGNNSSSSSSKDNSHSHSHSYSYSSSSSKVGFGEHTDPQILTILRSNDVGGLQISLPGGLWVPVPPDPTAFCVNVGDLLQAMSNGRFVSVRHRAMTNSNKPRLSMAYFGAPPLHACVTAPPELVTPHGHGHTPMLYRPFTWADYKKASYSLRLGDTRLDLFRLLL